MFAAVDPTLGDVEGAGADAWSDAAEDLDPAERATADLSRPGADLQALADLSELLGPKLSKSRAAPWPGRAAGRSIACAAP